MSRPRKNIGRIKPAPVRRNTRLLRLIESVGHFPYGSIEAAGFIKNGKVTWWLVPPIDNTYRVR